MSIAPETYPAQPALGASRPHPNRIWLYTLIGLMQLFWTANFLIGKVALREFPALLVAGLRVILAAAVILPFYWWKAHGRRRWTRRDVPWLFFLGLVGVGVNQFFFIVGLSRTSVSHSSLIIGMTPISVLLIAAARRLEPITARKLAGIVMAFAGVAVLSLEHAGGRPPASRPTVAGDLLTFLGGSAFALYTVLGKEVSRRYDSLTVNTFLFVSAGLCLIPVVIWQGWSFPFGQITAAGWLSLVYMAVFPSLVCYLIFYYALSYVAASRLSTLAYLQPLAATLGSVVFFGDRISAALLAGAVIILGGVYLTQRG